MSALMSSIQSAPGCLESVARLQPQPSAIAHHEQAFRVFNFAGR